MHRARAPRRLGAWLGVALCVLGAPATGAETPVLETQADPDPTPENGVEAVTAPVDAPRAAELRFSLSLDQEASWFGGREGSQPRASALALLQPGFAWRSGERWRVAASVTGLVETDGQTEGVLRLKETYASVSLGAWDFMVGRKLVRWGTGYAFTPTGVLDPPRDPTDPADRLSLNEGRDLVGAVWVRGRHALTGAWASAGVVGERRPGTRETAALRYNVLVRGVDTSLVYAHQRGGFDTLGANFTCVLGSAVELHGELAHRAGRESLSFAGLAKPLPLRSGARNAFLFGAKLTHRSRVNLIAELYSTNGLVPISPTVALSPSGEAELLTERRSYVFFGLNKGRLRERPGWKDWDLGLVLLASLRDHSRLIIVDVQRRVRLRYALHGRLTLPGGGKGVSEYGMIPYAAQASLGLRVQF
jgi:hypothetical protein